MLQRARVAKDWVVSLTVRSVEWGLSKTAVDSEGGNRSLGTEGKAERHRCPF